MPKSFKRKRNDSDDFETIAKQLKRLEEELKQTRSRHRCRMRIVSSSSSSSRELTSSPDNQQGGQSTSSQDGQATTPTETSHAPVQVDSALVEIVDAGSSVAAQETSPDIHFRSSTTAAAGDELDGDILMILGEDPTTTVEYGKDIHKELASRLEHIATTGLSKEARKDLCQRYLVPSNCTRISAPELNAEIKAALNESNLKRDKAIEARQKQLASAISCLSQITSDQLLSKDTNHELLKKLMDAGRLLCDIQFAESVTRRNFAAFSLKKEMKEPILNTKIDKLLFGDSLPDALKTAKAVTKSGTDLKLDRKQTLRPTTTTQNPVAKNLNWKPPAPARRQPEPPRSREPAPQRAQPGTSSKHLSYPQRTTRRR